VGALIPSMGTHYGIGYKVVSFIFLAVAVGFILTATIAHTVYSYVGRARTVMLGTATLSIAFLIIAMAPPFPVVVLGFFLIGVGMTMVGHFLMLGFELWLIKAIDTGATERFLFESCELDSLVGLPSRYVLTLYCFPT
jgi:MFS family permease